MFSRQRKERYRRLVIPGGLYLLFFFISQLVGFTHTKIPTGFYQLLDVHALQQRPIFSIPYLHSQPPLLNTLLAFILKVGSFLTVDPEMVARIVFLFLGISSVVLFFQTLSLISNTKIYPVFGVISLLASPAFHVFQSLYFYPFLLIYLFIGLLYCGVSYIYRKDPTFLHFSLVFAFLICNTSSLYHYLWEFILLGVLLVIHKNLSSMRKVKFNLVSVIFLLLIIFWPLKNTYVFGDFTYTSWRGFNLAKGVGLVQSTPLDRYIETGYVPEEVNYEIEQFREQRGLPEQEPFVLVSPDKSTGERNWNHYIFLKYNEQLTMKATQYRFSNFKRWLSKAGFFYFSWFRPSFVNSYTGKTQGPNHPLYMGCTELLKQTIYKGFRPAVESSLPYQNHV